MHCVEVCFVGEVFRQAQNELERIIDVVCDAGGKRADSRKFFRMEQLSLQRHFMLDKQPEQPRRLAIDDVGSWRHLFLER